MPKHTFTVRLNQEDARKIADALEVGADGLAGRPHDRATRMVRELRAFANGDHTPAPEG